MYAYILASNKIISADIVSLKKLIKDLRNTLSAIVTSPDGRPTFKQEEQLKSLYGLINGRFQSAFLSPLLKEKSEKYHCNFYEILKQENLLDSWLRQNNLTKYQIIPFYANSSNKETAFDNYMKSLENQISSIEYNSQKPKTDIFHLPILQHNRINNIPEQKEFLTKLLNEYLEEAYNSEDFVQSRYEFAKSGGKVFKEHIQKEWEGSEYQMYINTLLRNLNEYSQFEIKSTDNLTLKSFACFCQKGESDIDKLEDYLISNEIGDFRIAFSLWGIIFGFANIPKTLTNDLFLSDDLEYIGKIYRYIFEQIHGIKLNGEIQKVQPLKQSVEKKSIPISESQKQVLAEDTKNNVSNDSDIKDKLKSCKLKPDQLDSICELYKKNHFLINDRFFAEIKKIRGVGNKAIEKIKESLNYNIQIKPNESIGQLPLEYEKPVLGTEFYNDSNIYYFIEPLIAQKQKKKFKEDLDWFQDEHKKGTQSQYYAKASRENQIVIDSFRRYIEKKKYANLLDIDLIIAELKKLYK
ncbi:hypothetical protein LJC16_02270 [Bacteroidales bacterium OttesenSCG-928-C19]|nr:hypothetical protein [Bacteroidales bacterium OttesenSCG-928-C19]